MKYVYAVMYNDGNSGTSYKFDICKSETAANKRRVELQKEQRKFDRMAKTRSSISYSIKRIKVIDGRVMG